MRKLSDYIDSFRGELFGKESGRELTLDKEGESVLKALQPVLTRHYDVLLGDAIRLLLEAKASQIPELRKYLAERALAVHEMVDLLLNGLPKKEEPKVPFGERVDRFNEVMERELGPAVKHLGQEIERMNARTKALKEQQKREAAGGTPGGMDKCLKRLSRVLFGFPKSTTT